MGKTLRATLGWLIYSLSYLIPRNTRLWVFIGWRASKEREVFAENPKYQFLYVAEHRRDVKAVWIGKDSAVCEVLRARGYNAYPAASLHGVWYSLRAGYTFVGALLRPENWMYAGGTRLIQLWHSKSLKKTGFNSPYSLSRYNRFLSGNLFKEPYRFIAISNFLSVFIESDFLIKKEKILVTGIPKHDVLFTSVKGADIDIDTRFAKIVEKARSQRPNRLILYGPTFRPDGSNPLADLNLAAFDAFLRERNDICIISLHPKFSAKDWIPKGTELRNIHFSQSDFDIYPLMNEIDVLITDYSSLCFDFLVMNKPIIRYAFDFTSFKGGMGIYDELWNVIPGPIAFTFPELLTALSEDLRTYEEKIASARNTLFTFMDGNAAKRIADALLPKKG